MKITNANFTRDAVVMAYHQIMQLLNYSVSQPAPFTARNPKLSMDITVACQEQAQMLFANMFSIEVKDITFMERIIPGQKESLEVKNLGLPRAELKTMIRIHEFNMEEGFRVWDWIIPMADPQLISHTPIAKYSFED